MKIDIKTPQFPESIDDANIAKILVDEGQQVLAGQVLFEIETEKTILEVVAPATGVINKILIDQGQRVVSEQEAIYLIVSDDEELSTHHDSTGAKDQTNPTQHSHHNAGPGANPSDYKRLALVFGLISLVVIAIIFVFGSPQ